MDSNHLLDEVRRASQEPAVTGELHFRKDLYKGIAEYYDRFRLPYPDTLLHDLRARACRNTIGSPPASRRACSFSPRSRCWSRPRSREAIQPRGRSTASRRSTLITSAPRSARMRVATGPATTQVKLRTRGPVRGSEIWEGGDGGIGRVLGGRRTPSKRTGAMDFSY